MNPLHPPAAAYSRSPDIRVHIDRLVLTGLDVRDRAALGAAVQAQLARAFQEQGWANPPLESVQAPRLTGESIRPAASGREVDLGAQIARSVHGGLVR